jgi:hypothetical protein
VGREGAEDVTVPPAPIPKKPCRSWEEWDPLEQAEADRFSAALKRVHEEELRIRRFHENRYGQLLDIRPFEADGITLKRRTYPDEPCSASGPGWRCGRLRVDAVHIGGQADIPAHPFQPTYARAEGGARSSGTHEAYP